ncbi:hypothetical protein ACODT3_11000 [Streptomyces sp. 4.24]|uniref:hypothetical protein n=1 Tax=Streptomyces tritrimontium TaxID=3406573 RepID=UPI003BB4984C
MLFERGRFRSAAPHLLPPVLERLCARHPGIRPEVRVVRERGAGPAGEVVEITGLGPSGPVGRVGCVTMPELARTLTVRALIRELRSARA